MATQIALQDIVRTLSRVSPAAEGEHAALRFELEDGRALRVTVGDGRIHAVEGDGPADVVVSCTASDLLDIATGRRNLLTALLQGRIHAHGDLHLLKRFHGCIRSEGPQHRSVAS